MSKEQADAYFVTLIPTLTPIVDGIAYKQNKRYDSDAVINEAYLHMLSNLEVIENENELKKLVINFIKQNITWTNSSLNKTELLNKNNPEQPIILNDIDDFDVNLEQKIIIEKWYDAKQSILFNYRQQLKDNVKAVIFDCFFKKKITKGVHLAKHLNINKDAACKYIRELKSDIRKYTEENDIKA
jgi:hypothetical protein